MDSMKKKALQAALTTIQQQHGQGALKHVGHLKNARTPVYSTGSLKLDLATGAGGLPRGRIVEISGEESSGKTTLALQTIAEAQKAGGVAAFVDAEGTLGVPYAHSLGVDVDELLVCEKPASGEQALSIVEQLLVSKAVDVIVVDSVTALVPKAELGRPIGSEQHNDQARMMSDALRKLNALVIASDCLLIFTNQLRYNTDAQRETTTGGNALHFYASVRIELKVTADLPDDAGIAVAARVFKNKVGRKNGRANLEIFPTGTNKAAEVVDLGIRFKVIEQSSNQLSYEGHNLGKSRNEASDFLASHADIGATIEAAIRNVVAQQIPREEKIELAPQQPAEAEPA